MNKIKISKILLLFAVLTLTSCNYNYVETEQNSNNSTQNDNSINSDFGLTTDIASDSIINSLSNSTQTPTIVAQTQIPEKLTNQTWNCPKAKSVGSSQMKDMYIDILGLDESSASRIEFFKFRIVDSNNYFTTLQGYFLDKNACNKLVFNNSPRQIYNKSTNGSSYIIEMQDKKNGKIEIGTTNTGQKCTIIEQEGKKDDFEAIVRIDCRRIIGLKSYIPKKLVLDFTKNQTYYLPKPMAQTNDGKEIQNPKLIFSFANPEDANVATLDTEGKIIFKKAGKVTINVQGDPKFYTSKTLSYEIETKKSHLNVQKIDIGQSSVLPIGTDGQIIAPNNKTLIRALIYSPDSTELVKKQLAIISSAGTTRLPLTCPKNLNTKEFAENHYNLDDTCYAILTKPEELQNLHSGSILQFEFNNITRYETPVITKPLELKLTLVKGKNSAGDATLPDLNELKKAFKQAYPLTKVSIDVRNDTLYLDKKNDLSDALTKIKKLQNSEDKNRLYYGFIPSNTCAGVLGLGVVGGTSAVGLDLHNCPRLVAVERTMMHEVGHNLGLGHAPCGTQQGIIDSFWKSNAYQGVKDAQLKDAPLFMQESKKLQSPTELSPHNGRTRDLMAYCNGVRFTTHNYSKLAKYMSGNKIFAMQTAQAMQKSPQMQMAYGANLTAYANQDTRVKYQRILSGEILLDANKILLDPIELNSNDLARIYTPNKFGYLVKVQTENTSIEYPLQILQLDHSPKLMFSLVIPIDFADDIKSLEFKLQDKIIPYELNTSSRYVESKPNAKSDEIVKLAKTEFINFANDTLVWRSQEYPYLTSVFVGTNGKRHLLLDKVQSQNGIYKLGTKAKYLQSGRLEVYISNGLNNKVRVFAID